MKRMMGTMLPTCRIFLDVDDLVETANLETYVFETHTILLFLSTGCELVLLLLPPPPQHTHAASCTHSRTPIMRCCIRLLRRLFQYELHA